MTLDAKSPTWKAHLLWSLVALASFHSAQIVGVGWLLVPCAYALIELSRTESRRKVFYPLLALGFLFYAPQLGFFWNIFGAAAIALWLVLALWLALFGLTLFLVRRRFGTGWMLALAPFIWTGLEYFRSELYYLRFGWMTFGMGNHWTPGQTIGVGSFFTGFALLTFAALIQLVRSQGNLNTILLLSFATLQGTILTLGQCGGGLFILAATTACVTIVQLASRLISRVGIALVCLLFALGLALPEMGKSRVNARPKNYIPVAGVQLEFPNEQQVLSALNRTRAQQTNAQLFMLSEYTFQSPPPPSVCSWCATNQVYLVVGGTEPHGSNFYNMAYVIGTNGNIVHKQVKSVPIQFFKDGLPAPERKVWDSPWGKLGVLTCYDLSYTRVVDDFVRQGAIALLNPTMDVADWGAQQHNLHARVAPIRAAEYGIPIFRVASSGISQIVSSSGRVLASAPFPGEGKIIAGQLPLNAHPRLPLDRYLAPVCIVVAGFALIASLIPTRKQTSSDSESPQP